MKIATVVGARPQFIKAATVSRALRSRAIEEILIHTGQHHDEKMSDVFFSEMEIPKPDYNLGVAGLSHGAMTGEMLKRIEEVLISVKPDALLVFGDTNSTLAGALAAAKLHIPVAHVEAGLRSFNMRMPEEINRVLTDRVSKWLFCPTQIAVKNLENEGFKNSPAQTEITMTGDVMLDAARFYRTKAKWPETLDSKLQSQDFIFCTVHRAENTDHPANLSSIVGALRKIAETRPVVWPVHPRTKKILSQMGLSTDGLTLIDPVGYFESLSLLENCRLVMTDSGGLQKEAYFFNKPCVVLREETEWRELVDAKVAFLAGSDSQKIRAQVDVALSQNHDWPQGLYGNGGASELIADQIRKTI